MSKYWQRGDMAIFYGDKRNNGQYDNGVWMDLLDIPYITKLEDAGLYNVVIRTLWLDAVGWSNEIRNKFPDVTQIGLIDHPLSAHISKLSATRQYEFLSDLEYLDGIMALTDEEEEFYSIAVPSIPVKKVGLPFPFETYEKSFGHLKNLKDRPYIGLGVGAADNDRNFISNVLAFRYLQLKNPELKGVFLSVPQTLLQYCSYLADKYENIYIHERVNMDSFYEMLAQCKFVFNLTDRNTPGRLQGEAAFFGVPVVGANRLELQNELWPRFAISPYSLKQAVANGEYILSNDVSRDQALAYKKLETYNYDNSRKAFDSLLQQIKG